MTEGYYNPETRYQVLRSVIREDLAILDDETLAYEISANLPGVTADELEFSFKNLAKSLGPAMSQVGNVAVRAAPGAISGAMQGATMGAALGPYGMLAGAALGAVGGGITSYSQSQQQPAQPQQPQPAPTQQPAVTQPHQARPQQAPQPTYAPARTAQPQGSAPSLAIAQLLQVLSRPEVIQAIMSLSVGAMGRQNIRVGTQNVRPSEIMEVLEYTLSESAHQQPEWGHIEAGYTDGSNAARIVAEMVQTPAEHHPFYHVIEATNMDSPSVSTGFPNTESYGAYGY